MLFLQNKQEFQKNKSVVKAAKSVVKAAEPPSSTLLDAKDDDDLFSEPTTKAPFSDPLLMVSCKLRYFDIILRNMESSPGVHFTIRIVKCWIKYCSHRCWINNIYHSPFIIYIYIYHSPFTEPEITVRYRKIPVSDLVTVCPTKFMAGKFVRTRYVRCKSLSTRPYQIPLLLCISQQRNAFQMRIIMFLSPKVVDQPICIHIVKYIPLLKTFDVGAVRGAILVLC